MDELTDAQFAELRALIAQEQRRTQSRLAALQRDFDDIVSASADAVRDDEHDPEGATIAFERAQVASLLADARARLAALEAAAGRLEQPGAGSCEHCGEAIGFQRLVARPAATRCVRCAG